MPPFSLDVLLAVNQKKSQSQVEFIIISRTSSNNQGNISQNWIKMTKWQKRLIINCNKQNTTCACWSGAKLSHSLSVSACWEPWELLFSESSTEKNIAQWSRPKLCRWHIFVNFSEISEINEKLKIEEKDFKLQKDRSIFGHRV